MVTSPFLLSISMWGMVAAALWNVTLDLHRKRPDLSMKSLCTWMLALGQSFKNLWHSRYLLLMTLLLLVPAISIFWSEDLSYWIRVTRVRLPFLVLPWTFANFPAFDSRAKKKVLYLLPWFMVLLCIGVGINFLMHYDSIMLGLSRGQPVPVPRQHVRFSLVLATAIMVGAWLWKQKFYLKFIWERRALAIAVVFLFVFIHILAVRGGLAVLYIAIVSSLFLDIWKTKRWLRGALLFGSLLVLIIVALQTIPSLKQRVAYMKYDWERYLSNEGEAYSDSERWVSLEVGYRVWRNNPMLGTGAGDLMNEVKRVNAAEFPEYTNEPKLPHNQWLHIMASTGLFGLALSLIAFLFPLFSAGDHKGYLFVVFQIMAFATFIIECTVENAIGVSWYLFYTLWFAGLKE